MAWITDFLFGIQVMAWITDHSVNRLFVRYSGHGLNNRPFDDRTCLDHLNTRLVRYSDPHCIWMVRSMMAPKIWLPFKVQTIKKLARWSIIHKPYLFIIMITMIQIPYLRFEIHWGSEYQPFEYQKHLNTKLFEVGISNGQYIRK